ncbi:Palmdelphin [Bagarius yarrelli]|uniref:Palmdelphin n=1 Tax=Bagarius yarrelli TaxID=175774 RepID=A0A556U5V9_BAGYA|nr:Palmdelphin [Bagarius yarrelli]
MSVIDVSPPTAPVRAIKVAVVTSCGLQKEIETLEMEELNISLNEGLILNRLKAIEKSTEDIIKAANENFKSEPLNIYSGISDIRNDPPSNVRKQLSVDPEAINDIQKPAVFAMEINVQKDLRTGESRVLSTCTVPAQEIQQRGIKVYDDGRKSVYALHSTLDQPEANGVDDLSPNEVEELLKQATANRTKPQEQTEPMCHKNYQSSHCPEPNNMVMSVWPELEYSQKCLHQEIHEPAHMLHNYSYQHEDYHNSNDNSYKIHREIINSDKNQFYEVRERHSHQDVNYIPPLSYSEEPKLGILNTLPLDEPVTMIFMGYQKAEEDAHSYEGSVQAELIIIDDGEEEASTECPKTPDCAFQDHNTNTLLTSETSSPASLNQQALLQVLDDGTQLKGFMEEIEDC